MVGKIDFLGGEMKEISGGFIILICILSFSNLIEAKSSEEYLDYLSSVIYEDCKEYNIYMNPYENQKDNFGNPVYLKYNGEDIKEILWPYTQKDMRTIIRAFDTVEFAILRGGYLFSGQLGYVLFSCGLNKNNTRATLDNDGQDFLWKGEVVDVPKSEFTNVYAKNYVSSKGDNNHAIAGDNSFITQNN